jgi:hypothetical protein
MSKPSYAEIKGQVSHLIELRGVYDGWSIAVLDDGTFWNRWEPEDGRRYTLTEQAIYDYTNEKVEAL